jgi:hypothetical protein
LIRYESTTCAENQSTYKKISQSLIIKGKEFLQGKKQDKKNSRREPPKVQDFEPEKCLIGNNLFLSLAKAGKGGGLRS